MHRCNCVKSKTQSSYGINITITEGIDVESSEQLSQLKKKSTFVRLPCWKSPYPNYLPAQKIPSPFSSWLAARNFRHRTYDKSE